MNTSDQVMVKDVVKDQPFMVKDLLHNYLDTTQIPFVKELILILCVYLFYHNSSFETFTFFIKYAFILFIIRYVLSTLTYKYKEISNKKYFDLNAHVILLTLIVLLSNKYNKLPNEFLTWLIIVVYGLLVISTRENFTSDVIITIFIVYIFVNYKDISRYIVNDTDNNI